MAWLEDNGDENGIFPPSTKSPAAIRTWAKTRRRRKKKWW